MVLLVAPFQYNVIGDGGGADGGRKGEDEAELGRGWRSERAGKYP